MANLITWDDAGKRFYETGVDRGVLYVQSALGTYPEGVAWNGLVSVNESPSGAEANPLYADNVKYLNLVSAEEFGATIECYTYPDDFVECDGSKEVVEGALIGQQSRKAFGLAYRTKIGNDVNPDLGYKLHLVYGCLASPSEKAFSSINENPEAVTFSYEVTTTPVTVTGFKPTATMVIDSTKVGATELAELEVILYGVAGTTPTPARLPLPDEIITILTP